MKKRVFSSLFVVLVVLVASFVAAQAPMTQEQKDFIEENYDIEVEAEYSQELKEALNELKTTDGDGGKVGMGGFSVKSRGRLTIIGGTVYDIVTMEPVPNVPIRIYCHHYATNTDNLIKEKTTNDQGFYTVWTFNILPKRRCIAGDDAWIEVDYQGQTWTSDPVTVESALFYDHATVNAFVGVPEFSTYTLGLAVIFGCLGLVLMRRRH